MIRGSVCILKQPKWSMSDDVIGAAVTVKPPKGPAQTLFASVTLAFTFHPSKPPTTAHQGIFSGVLGYAESREDSTLNFVTHSNPRISNSQSRAKFVGTRVHKLSARRMNRPPFGIASEPLPTRLAMTCRSPVGAETKMPRGDPLPRCLSRG
jgi:hypothetical protein